MSTEKVFSVVSLLSTILSNDPNLEKYSVKLNKKTIQFLNELLQKSPDELEKFQELFLSITEDMKINLNDVPIILELLKTIYEMAANYAELKVSLNDIINLSQFILTELANVKGLNKNTITQINLIVESVSGLLVVAGVKTKKPINVKKYAKFNLFGCLGK